MVCCRAGLLSHTDAPNKQRRDCLRYCKYMNTILNRLILAVSLGAAFASAQTLMPLPASMQPASGELRVDSAFRIGYAKPPVPRLARAGTRFLRQLSVETGIPLRNISASDSTKATL